MHHTIVRTLQNRFKYKYFKINLSIQVIKRGFRFNYVTLPYAAEFLFSNIKIIWSIVYIHRSSIKIIHNYSVAYTKMIGP
jgi:hypothetical protein